MYFQYSEFRAHYSVFQGKRKLLKNPECKKYIKYSEHFQGKLCSSGQAQSCSKILNGKKYMYSAKFQGKLCFSGQAHVAHKSWMVKKFNTVYSLYIYLGVIRVIWASVVCNLDQSRDWL